jgi:Tfp pilus assembly protein PilF
MKLRSLVVLGLFLGACSSLPLQPPGQVQAPAAESPPHGENTAIASLMDTARAEADAGRLANAAAALERGLRIEPRNPRLWQALARVHLRQGDYDQAENTAKRSSSWAGGDSALRSENWRLIAQAREARGDAAGARAALQAAGEPSK